MSEKEQEYDYSRLPKSEYNGKLPLNGVEVDCHVLDDGRRVISGRSMTGAIGMKGRARGLKRVPEHSTLRPFLSDQLVLAIEQPILFRGQGSRRDRPMNGHEATILVDLAEAILKARDDNKLTTEAELRYADFSDKLIRAFAQVGIIALVDEATGYQYDREKDELQQILKAYINEELLPWQKKFPDIFYREIFRLNKWGPFMSGNIDIKKRPGVVGHWTNELIYRQLPKGILEELKRLTPKDDKGRRKHKFHQLLSNDVGNPHLQQQLTSVVTIMKLSKDWKDFMKKFNQLYGQTSLDFPEPEPELSEFDKKLQTALEFNPREKTK